MACRSRRAFPVSAVPQCHRSRRHGAVSADIPRNRVCPLTTPAVACTHSKGIFRTDLDGFALEQRADSARGNLQHRAAGGARAQPRRGQGRHASARLSALTRRAPAQQRKGPAGGIPIDRARGGRRPHHHAGRRVGARQLSRDRGTDPRDPRRSAAGLLSPAAQTCGWSLRRISRACSASHGRSSRTPTAASIRNSCAASSAPIRPWNR